MASPGTCLGCEYAAAIFNVGLMQAISLPNAVFIGSASSARLGSLTESSTTLRCQLPWNEPIQLSLVGKNLAGVLLDLDGRNF